MTAKINDIEYSIHSEGADIICIPSDPNKDDHTLVLHGGYSYLKSEAYNQAKTIHQVDEIAADLMTEYVLQNEEELIRIEP